MGQTAMWTDERVEQLKQLWGGGMTAAQIAERIGGTSRNAVIGKAHRLGLSVSKAPKPRTVAPNLAKPAPGAENAAENAAVNAAVNAAAPPPKSRPASPQSPALAPAPPKRQPDVNAADLPWHRRCQWPIGHPGERDFHFCGAAAADSKPYCNEHCAMAYRQREVAA